MIESKEVFEAFQAVQAVEALGMLRVSHEEPSAVPLMKNPVLCLS